jgi:hypothetical protein
MWLQEQLERASSGSRNDSVKAESLDGVILNGGRSHSGTLDLTGFDIKKEETVESPKPSGSTLRTHPTAPLFLALASNERAGEEEDDGHNTVAKRARLAAETPMPSVEGQTAGKRRRLEDKTDEDDVVELLPPPRRARFVELLDLTDD